MKTKNEEKRKEKKKRTFQISTPSIPIVVAREVSDSLKKNIFKNF